MNTIAHYVTKGRVLCRVVDDEAVVLDLDDGQYYGLNSVGTRLWQLLSQGASLSAICNALVAEFEVGRDEVRADVDAFLAELIEKGLVILEEESSGT